MLDILDNYDSIIYYQTDSQYHSKECQGINWEIKNNKWTEGTNQRNRYRQQRNQSRSCVLQEYKYNQNNQKQCLYESINNLLNGVADIISRVNDRSNL